MSETPKYQPTYTVAEFNTLSRVDQRKAVALDVLKQLAMDRLIPSSCYLMVDVSSDKALDRADIRDLLVESKEPCQVCALGAVFASAVCLGDEVKADSQDFTTTTGDDEAIYTPNSDAMRQHLDYLFGFDQLRLIERCYENWLFATDAGSWGEAYRFRQQFTNRHDAMVGIMESIANHPEGRFEPSVPLEQAA